MEAHKKDDTALEVVTQDKPSTLIKPLVSPDDLIEHHKTVTDLIGKALKAGQDYGKIQGTKRETLLKPGAERIAIAFGTAPIYSIVESEVDHDRRVEWTKRKKVWRNAYQGDRHFDWEEESGTSAGLYRYVVRCDLQHRKTTEVIGSGIASCSTMESKYIDRPRETENTIVKMAQKRALVAAVLNAFGLSNRFTQDLEDQEHDPETPANNRQQKQKTAQQKADTQAKDTWTNSIWDTLKNSGHPDINGVWNRAGAAAKAKSADVATIAQQKKFKESVLSQIDDWRATKDDVPAEEFGKMFLSEEQVNHLVEMAKTSNPDFYNEDRILAFCKTVLKNRNINELKHLTFDEYEQVLNILDTHTGDQRYIPLEEREQS